MLDMTMRAIVMSVTKSCLDGVGKAIARAGKTVTEACRKAEMAMALPVGPSLCGPAATNDMSLSVPSATRVFKLRGDGW